MGSKWCYAKGSNMWCEEGRNNDWNKQHESTCVCVLWIVGGRVGEWYAL